MQQRVRNRQETCNNRFKFWHVLQNIFRHDLSFHGTIFRSIAVITQIAIHNGEKLFDCGYKDPPYAEDEDVVEEEEE